MTYAKDELELPLDMNICSIDVDKKEKSTKHKPFTVSEIKLFYVASKTDFTASLLLVYLFTSMRPNEFLNIKVADVFLNENYSLASNVTYDVYVHMGVDKLYEEVKK